jgi:hypothetical protein
MVATQFCRQPSSDATRIPGMLNSILMATFLT